MIVIKLGGRVQSDPRLIAVLAARWTAEPGSFCIVHGGGDEVSSLQQQLGRQPSFIDGRRITSEADVELVRMVLSGSANKRLVSGLVAAHVPAVGISGEDAGMLEAVAIDAGKFGRAGRPVSVRKNLIEALLSSGFLPVISPVARDAEASDGAALNVNGDDAAARIAAEMQAELWLIADVDGVMDRDRNILPSLDAGQTGALVSAGVVNRGMHAKLEAGFEALGNGATKVRVAGLGALEEKQKRQGTHLKLETQ